MNWFNLGINLSLWANIWPQLYLWILCWCHWLQWSCPCGNKGRAWLRTWVKDYIFRSTSHVEDAIILPLRRVSALNTCTAAQHRDASVSLIHGTCKILGPNRKLGWGFLVSCPCSCWANGQKLVRNLYQKMGRKWGENETQQKQALAGRHARKHGKLCWGQGGG